MDRDGRGRDRQGEARQGEGCDRAGEEHVDTGDWHAGGSFRTARHTSARCITRPRGRPAYDNASCVQRRVRDTGYDGGTVEPGIA